MTDIASLAIEVDARGPEQASRSLDRLHDSAKRTESQTDRLTKAERELAREARSSAGAHNLLAGAIAGVGLTAAASTVAGLADEYTVYTNQLRIAGLEGRALTSTQDALFVSAQKAGAPVAALGTLYGRAASSAKELGASQAELLTFTDLVATSLKVGGRSAAESSGALLQLSQVLGGAKVQAEEYNSLIDGLRPLLLAVAAGSDQWGGSVARLSADVKAGKVATSEFFDSALRGKAVLDDMAGRAIPTLSASFTRLDNALGKYVGQTNDALSVTARVASAVDLLAENLDTVIPVAATAAAYLGTRWAASGAQFFATEAAKQLALARTAGLMATSAAGARGLLAVLGGPWGIAFAAAAGGVYLLHRAMGAAERENEALKTSLGGAAKALDEYETAALEAASASGKDAKAMRDQAEAARKVAEDKVAAARATREKSLADAEAADRALADARAQRLDRIKAAGAFGGDPIGIALAATAPEALAEQRVVRAKSRAEAATEAAAAAEARYQKILGGSTNAAAAASTTLDDNNAKKRGAKEATDDLIKGLREEIQEIGRTEKEIRRLEIARAAADAPLKSQKAIILQLGEQREAALEAAAAWEWLAELKAANDDRTLTPLQQTQRENRSRLNDIEAWEGGALSVLGEEARLAAENAEQFAIALSLIPNEIQTIHDAIPEDLGLLNLQRDLDALQILEAQATQAADNIAAAFGKTGAVIGASLKAFTNYQSTRAALDARLYNGEITAAQRSLQLTNARVRGYGDMTAAAKTFFKEGSAGYRALEVAEVAFRTVETLNTVQAMALDARETAASVTNSGARASADGIAAYAKTLASLPFPFNLAAGATVLAALAAVGVTLKGGGSRGAAPGSTDQADRQVQQGAGSVLGDATAKSASLERALEISQRNQNKDLEYSNQMVRALRNIESSMDVLAAAVARTIQVSGGFDGAGLGLGSSFNKSGLAKALFSGVPLLGGFLSSLFGTKTTRELQDSGLTFADQTLGDILSGGLQGQSFQQVLETRKKKFLGVTTSKKQTVSTDFADLDASLEADFTRVIASLRDGVLAAASVIGVQGAEATLDAFTLSLGTISLKDLKGEELERALAAVFGKAADQLATAVLPGVEKFQKVGEGAFETLTRLARNYTVVDVTLQSIGKTFTLVGVESLEARERLVALAGGLDALQEGTAFFAENFLTEAERLAPIQKAVNDELKRLGLESVQTRDQFKDVVLGIDVTTEAGAELYAALITLAPAFAKVTEHVEDLRTKAIETADQRVSDARSAVNDIKDQLREVYQQQSADLTAKINAFNSNTSSLRSHGDRLAAQAAETDPRRYESADAAFRAAAAAVRANPEDRDAFARLQAAGDAFLAASRDSAATELELGRDQAAVRREVEAATKIAQGQADLAQGQLDALTAQLGQHIELNKTAKSIEQLLIDLNAANRALVQALADRAAFESTPANDAIDVARYLASNPDLARNWNAGGSLRGAGSSLEAAALAHYITTGRHEIAAGLRGYARGTDAAWGGDAVVGEQGPEVVSLPAGAQVTPNDLLRQIAAGGQAEIVRAILSVQRELAGMRGEHERKMEELNRLLRTLERVLVEVTQDGEAMLTEAAA